MRPSTEPTCSLKAMWKLGLFVLVVLLPLSLLSCASSKELAQDLKENHGNFLTPLPSAPVPQPAAKSVAQPVDNLAALPVVEPEDKPAAKRTDKASPLKVCSVVPEDDLQDMRGCLGVYFFNYDFDINLLTTPQVSVSSKFQAVLPDGSPAPTANTTSAVFKDSNVSYISGPTSTGLSSQLVVTGQNNIVFANTQFNIHLPNASVLTPTMSILPANSLSGIGR